MQAPDHPEADLKWASVPEAAVPISSPCKIKTPKLIPINPKEKLSIPCFQKEFGLEYL